MEANSLRRILAPLGVATRAGMGYHVPQGRSSAQIEKVSDTMTFTGSFPLWPVLPFGAEGDGNDNGDSGSGSSAEGDAGKPGNGASQGNLGEGNQGGDKSGSGSSSSDNDDDDEDDDYKGLSLAEVKRIAADNAKNAKASEKERKKLADAEAKRERDKNDENTNLKNDLAERDSTIESLRATIVKQAIEGAIRDDSRFEWHDLEMVAQQLDPNVVSVDDNGKVEGLKSQLPKVAKQHPFLLKKDNTQENNGSGNRQNQNGPTGFQPGQGGTSGGAGNEPDAKALAENYPALAARN